MKARLVITCYSAKRKYNFVYIIRPLFLMLTTRHFNYNSDANPKLLKTEKPYTYINQINWVS